MEQEDVDQIKVINQAGSEVSPTRIFLCDLCESQPGIFSRSRVVPGHGWKQMRYCENCIKKVDLVTPNRAQRRADQHMNAGKKIRKEAQRAAKAKREQERRQRRRKSRPMQLVRPETGDQGGGVRDTTTGQHSKHQVRHVPSLHAASDMAVAGEPRDGQEELVS